VVQMSLERIGRSTIAMRFEYLRGEEVVARGSQEVACLRRENGGYAHTNVPDELRTALEQYAVNR
jgi:enediyne core biosynthesis thioesterase